MLKIRQIDHIVLRVVDLEAMLKFYVGVLGCAPEKNQEEVGLYQVRAGNLDHLCLRLDPFDPAEITAELKEKGVDVGPVSSRYGGEGFGPSIYVKDPEGNTVELRGGSWS